MQPDPDPGRWDFARVCCALDFGDELPRSVDSVLAMIPHYQRCTEHSHESVTEELVHDPVMPVNDFDGIAPEPVQIVDDRVRRRRLGKCGEIANIENENTNIAQLRFKAGGLG